MKNNVGDILRGKTTLSKQQQKVVLPVFVAVGLFVAIATTGYVAYSINVASNKGNATSGLGFKAFVEDGTTLDADKIVTSDKVANEFKGKVSDVSKVDLSKVFNYNGTRGQTASYYTVRNDGRSATVYVDKMVFKNQSDMDSQNIFSGTVRAKEVNGLQTYFMHAETVGMAREYRLMVVDGLTAYKFVFSQPATDITVNEVSAMASLMKLVGSSSLKA